MLTSPVFAYRTWGTSTDRQCPGRPANRQTRFILLSGICPEGREISPARSVSVNWRSVCCLRLIDPRSAGQLVLDPAQRSDLLGPAPIEGALRWRWRRSPGRRVCSGTKACRPAIPKNDSAALELVRAV